MPRVRQVARAFKECTRSRRTAMFPLQLRPASAVDPRALLPHVQKDFEQIARDGLGAKSTLVVETFSEESFFRPRGAAQDRRREEPRGARGRESAWSEEHAGVEFKFKQGEPVLLCKRYMPKTEHTTWSFVSGPGTTLRNPAQLCCI